MSKLNPHGPRRAQSVGLVTGDPDKLARRIAQRIEWRSSREGEHPCLVYAYGRDVYVLPADRPEVRHAPADAVIGVYTLAAKVEDIADDVREFAGALA